MKKDKKFDTSKFRLILIIVFLSIIITFYFGVIIYNLTLIRKYDKVVLPNTYLQDYKLGDASFDKLNIYLNQFNNKFLQKKVKLNCNGRVYTYSFGDLGVSIDSGKIIDEVISSQKALDYNDKVSLLYGGTKKVYSYAFKYDDNVLRDFLVQLKQQVDVGLRHGYFDLSNGSVKYISGVDSFSLDVEKSLEVIKSSFNDKKLDSGITLVGSSEKAISNDSYSSIDTKVSSFYTEFNGALTSRVANLRTGLNYINGVVVEPGEVFSFYKYAGPYNKNGYVFYYEFVGNGVCQIATTVYNTVLLGGLEIVKRYPHAEKSVYVPGGLDATVASYSSGWNVDFQFRNTYKYPIYIQAYMVGNQAHVDFWSNSLAMEGKSYRTESVQIGARGYNTFLHTYKDGVEIDKSKIATTWYTK